MKKIYQIYIRVVGINFYLIYIYIFFFFTSDGLLLFSGGSEETSAAEQAGGGDVLAVPLQRRRGGHANGDEVLLYSVLLEVVESYRVQFLWKYFEILQHMKIKIKININIVCLAHFNLCLIRWDLVLFYFFEMRLINLFSPL